MPRTMYDAVDVSRIPADATMVAGYFDGAAIPSTLPALRARFPHAQVVTIAVRCDQNDADVYDVESGDIRPDQVPVEVVKGRQSGKDPTVYCPASLWQTVRDAFHAQHVDEPHYWIADYDGVAAVPAGAVAKQFSDANGYDTSVVADYWPGVDPTPAPKADDYMATKDVTIHVEHGTGKGYAPVGVSRDKFVSATAVTFQGSCPRVALNEAPALDGEAVVNVDLAGPTLVDADVVVRVAFNA